MEQQETKIAKKDLIRKKTGYPGMEIHKSGEVEYLTFPALDVAPINQLKFVFGRFLS